MVARAVVLAGVLGGLLGLDSRAAAEQVAPLAGPGGTPVAPADKTRLSVIRTSTAPVIDGKLDDPVWALARSTSDFTQRMPDDGAAPSHRTTMRVLYDSDALYVAFDCEQPPASVTRFLTRRDADSESDWVWLLINTRRNSHSAPFFAVSAAGVLQDGIARDGEPPTLEWDEVWESEVALTSTGWSVEMRIPLRVLRFTEQDSPQSWGFWASRYISAWHEEDDWPHIARDVSAPIALFGSLDDLRDLRPGGMFELRPFALGRVRYRGADPMLVESGLDAGASAGLDAKLHITQSLTLDAAINPDFAQVEADRLILNLNNLEILYPEKRGLFLEGADAFATPLGLFYSRRIGSSPATPSVGAQGADPAEGRLVEVPSPATIYGAAKVVGRAREWLTIGALSAVASNNRYTVQLPDGTRERRIVEPLSAFSVLRLRADLSQRIHLGVIGTSVNRFESTSGSRVCPGGDTVGPQGRCFRDAYAGGADILLRSPGGHYVASGQVVGTGVREGLATTELDGTVIAPGDSGLGGTLRIAKDSGQPVFGEIVYTGAGRKLTYNDLGFMPRQNLHEGKAALELRSHKPGRLTLERMARLEVSAKRSLDGLDLGRLAELKLRVRLPIFWNILVAGQLAPARWDDREFGDGSALQRAGYVGAKLQFFSDPRRLFFVSIDSEARFLAGGFAVKGEMPLVLRPVPQIELQLVPQLAFEVGEPRYAWHATMGLSPGAYVFGDLRARNVGALLRATYVFTPRLTLQSYAQLFLAAGHYTNFTTAPEAAGSRVSLASLTPLAGPAPTDADFAEAAVNINVVLRWEYRLGSTLFLVYTRSQAPTVSLVPGEAADLRLAAIGRAPAVDIVLLKASFWWAS